MKNRDMFYENYSVGGYNNIPNTNTNMNMNQGMMYNGFMPNNQMFGYGPNIVPEQMNGYNNEYENLNQRITRCEKLIRNIDTRVQKLESTGLEVDDDNIYMI